MPCLTSQLSQTLWAMCLIMSLSIRLYAQEESNLEQSHSNHGFIDLNAYRDTRSFSEFTINLLANPHPRVQYFAFSNNTGASHTSETQSFYSEQNIRWKISKTSPLDLTGQLTLRSGEDNDNFKLGIRVRFNNVKSLEAFFRKIGLMYSLNFHVLEYHPVESVRSFVQFEHAYQWWLLPDRLNRRLYIGGFADQNFRAGSEQDEVMWVSEHQLGIRIVDQFYLVAEFRINDFLPSDNYGLGYGLEYKIVF